MLEFPARISMIKKPYEPPRLQTYGNLRSLTQGGDAWN